MALYFPDVHQATDSEVAMASAITRAAAIILSQDTQTLEHTRAAEALRFAQEKYRNLFETIDEGYALCQLVRDQTGRATDYRILELNKAFEQQIGAQRADFLGRTAREVFAHYDSWWIDTYARVVDTNQPERFEHRLDNTGRWYAISAYPRGGNHFAVIFDDITERKRRERQQAFLLRFSDSLRIQSDTDTLANRALQLLTEHLQLDRCYTAVYRLAEDRADITHQVGNERVPPMPQSIRPSDFSEAFQIVLTGTLVIDDVTTMAGLTQLERQNMETLGFSALVSATLRQGEHQPMWVLVAVSARPRAWRPDEIQLIEEVTERTWAALERAKAEDALRDSEQQFRMLADALPQAIWVTDPAGNIEFMNRWWADYSGIVFEPITAWQVAQDSLHPEDGPRLVAAFQQAMQQGEGFGIEQRNRSASGEYRWFLNMGVPYRDPKTGQITKWVGMSIDIDERKRAEQALADSEYRYRRLAADLEQRVAERTQALEQANQDLTRSNANLQQFAYAASHDLQEPLRKIQSFSSLLADQLDDQLTESSRSYLQRITAAGSRMSILIKDLLAYSRIATRQQTFGPASLTAIVRGVLTTLDWEIQQAQAQIQVDELPVVRGDESQLGQLFQNLLTNALKFVAPNEIPHVQIQYRQCSPNELPQDIRPGIKAPYYHQIKVVDRGVGFDEKFRDRMFEVFQRLHGKNEYPGSGVGLAICLRVVENHGGGITASSEPGHGATFCVYLPA